MTKELNAYNSLKAIFKKNVRSAFIQFADEAADLRSLKEMYYPEYLIVAG